MLRMSRLTDYGTLILTRGWRRTDAGCTRRPRWPRRHASVMPTVAKILKILTNAGLVCSQRGAHGGYRLARAPERITAAEIIDALEGPVAITECAARCISASSSRSATWAAPGSASTSRSGRALNEITLAQLAPGSVG